MIAPDAFELRQVVHLVRPWGDPVCDLAGLRLGVSVAPADVLFMHVVLPQLRDPGAGERPPDDFSVWVGGVLQDAETAERLSFALLGPTDSPAACRALILDVLDRLGDERQRRHTAPSGAEFRFLAATSLTLPSGREVADADALVEALATSDASMWFLHLVEEPWRSGGRMPLRDWLSERGERTLARMLTEAMADGQPLDESRARLARRWRRSRIGHQLAAPALPADAHGRREDARRVVASLLRRRGRKAD